MRVLLDACVPMPLGKHLSGHTVDHANCRGWQTVKNGELLKLAEREFDLFVTSDKNLGYQQNLSGRNLAILVLWTNDWLMLRARSQDIAAAVNGMQSGQYLELK